MIKIGQEKCGFQIKAEIGRGGMGTIYYAIDTTLNRDVALKVIHPDLARNVQLMERFKIEAMTQGQMNHPNIVTVFSFSEIDNENVIVMEYVDGKNLKTILRDKKILPISDAIMYLKQILKALEYSHSRNIIHRDIKPANILLDGNNHLKLSDFGIAKVFGREGLTKTGMLLGTPWYTPPEQVMGEKIDFRSDLYSVGITFYEMVTGKVPFNSETNSDFQVQKAHLETPPPRPSIFNPEIGSKIEKFILKSLQKKPERRFQSASEMLKEIESIEEKITETIITRDGTKHVTLVEAGIGKRKGKRLLLGSLLVCLVGLTLYFFTIKNEKPTSEKLNPVTSNITKKANERGKDKELTGSLKKQIIQKSTVNNNSKPIKSKQTKTIPKKIKTIKTKREKPIIIKKKSDSVLQKSEVILQEEAVKSSPVLSKKVISDIKLEAEIIRLERLVENKDFEDVEKSISKLIESGVKNNGLYSLAGKMRFIQEKFPEAERFWKDSIAGGGSVTLRFYHKHGLFNKGCSGQLVLKKGLIIFNSVTKRSHSFAATIDTIKKVKKRKGNSGIEISFHIRDRVKKNVFILRRRSRNGERFIAVFINKFILGVQ